LFELIWKIYYDFFATLNPAYEVYLIKKHKEWLDDSKKDTIISSIIQDLLYRPFNTDIFLLRNCCENFEIDVDYCNNIDNSDVDANFDIELNFRDWIETNNYRSIAQWILNVKKDDVDLTNVYNICLNIFDKCTSKLTKGKLLKDFMSVLKLSVCKNKTKNKNVMNINNNIILLAKIMCLFSKKNQLKMGRNIYISVEPEDIIIYETINGLTNYKILEKACICGIDDFKKLSLFKLNRYNYSSNDKFKETYWNHWEYYASFSPIWLERIAEFKGQINHLTKKVDFIEEPDDDLMQKFYELYGYEPDEQKLCVQNKSIIDIEKVNNWNSFYNKFKKNGIFSVYEEELEEFDNDGLHY
jgi:hypothetical protein